MLSEVAHVRVEQRPRTSELFMTFCAGAFSITRQAIQLGLAPRLDVEHTSAREMGQIIVTRRKGMAIWRERLFVLMARNAVRAKAFFRLPPERVVELGVQVEM